MAPSRDVGGEAQHCRWEGMLDGLGSISLLFAVQGGCNGMEQQSNGNGMEKSSEDEMEESSGAGTGAAPAQGSAVLWSRGCFAAAHGSSSPTRVFLLQGTTCCIPPGAAQLIANPWDS